MGRFLREAAAAASSSHAAVTAVVAAGDPRANGEQLDLTLEGRYADVLSAVRALSRTPVPATVAIASLERKSSANGSVTVSASVRALLPIRSPAPERHDDRPPSL